MGFKVEKANDSIGEEVEKQIKGMKDGGVSCIVCVCSGFPERVRNGGDLSH